MRGILDKVDTPLTSEEILSFALQATRDTFNLNACAIVLVDPSRKWFKVALARGWSNEAVKRYHAEPFAGLVAELAGLHAPLLVQKGDGRHGTAGYRFEDDSPAFLALPLAIRGKKIGFLYLGGT